jgi:hypothetical protein
LLKDYTQKHFLFTNMEKDIDANGADCLSPLDSNADTTPDVDAGNKDAGSELLLQQKV